MDTERHKVQLDVIEERDMLNVNLYPPNLLDSIKGVNLWIS